MKLTKLSKKEAELMRSQFPRGGGYPSPETQELRKILSDIEIGNNFLLSNIKSKTKLQAQVRRLNSLLDDGSKLLIYNTKIPNSYMVTRINQTIQNVSNVEKNEKQDTNIDIGINKISNIYSKLSNIKVEKINNDESSSFKDKISKEVYCYDMVQRRYYPILENNISNRVIPFTSISNCMSYFNKSGHHKFNSTNKWDKRIFIEKYISGTTKLVNRFVFSFDLNVLEEKINEIEAKVVSKSILRGHKFFIYFISDSTKLTTLSISDAKKVYSKREFDGSLNTESGYVWAIASSISKETNKPVMVNENVLVSYNDFDINDFDLDILRDELNEIRNTAVLKMLNSRKKYVSESKSWKEDWSINLKKSILNK
jgi:hypothetical protein